MAKKIFPYTPSVTNIYALESILEQALEEGMEAMIRRHETIAQAARRGVTAMGLELWVAREEIAASCVTGAVLPQGVDDEQLRARACAIATAS